MHKYDVMIGEKDKLIKPIELTLTFYIVTIDELFEVFTQYIWHGSRNRMMAELKTKYCNITKEAVMTYLGLYSNCQTKQSNTKKKTTN